MFGQQLGTEQNSGHQELPIKKFGEIGEIAAKAAMSVGANGEQRAIESMRWAYPEEQVAAQYAGPAAVADTLAQAEAIKQRLGQDARSAAEYGLAA